MSRHGLGRLYVKSTNPTTDPASKYKQYVDPNTGRVTGNEKIKSTSGWFGINTRDDIMPYVVSALDESLKNNALWNSLSQQEKEAAINRAYSSEPSANVLGWKNYDLDYNAIVDDFNRAQDILGSYDYDQLVAPDYDKIDEDLLTNYYQPIYDRIAQEQTDMKDMYSAQLKESADAYNYNANAILGNQMRQNAMIQDALRSDLSRTRQNALEAGASAGLRIAGNINATLAAQNKAAQTSMETSNNLAQLLLNQRQAAAGIRSDYRNYMSESNRYRDSQQSDYLNRRASERGLARDSWQDRINTAEDRLASGNLGNAYNYASGYLRNKIYDNDNTKTNTD